MAKSNKIKSNKVIVVTSKIGEVKTTRKIGVTFNSDLKTVIDIMSFCDEFNFSKLEKIAVGQTTAYLPFFKYTLDGKKWTSVNEKLLNSLVACINGIAIGDKEIPEFFYSVECKFSPSKNASFFQIAKNRFLVDEVNGVKMTYSDDVKKGSNKAEKSDKEKFFAYLKKLDLSKETILEWVEEFYSSAE